MFDSPEVQFAVRAVRQASQLVARVQKGMVTPALVKGDKSPVTVADYAAQALVGSLLERERPNDLLVGEEEATNLKSDDGRQTLEQVVRFLKIEIPAASEEDVCRWIERGNATPGKRFWTLDPVDGTKGFLRGEQYAVALALVVDGRVEIGVLGCPNLSEASRAEPGGPGSLVVAVRGQGTRSAPLAGGEWRKLSVSQLSDPAEARMLRSVEAGHTNEGQVNDVNQRFGAKAQPVLMDSQAKYAVLAAGAGDLMLRLLSPSKPNYREMIWDQAAGSLVIEEAGGRVTDLDGKPLDFTQGRTLASNRGVVASNAALHSVALEVLRSVGA